MRDRDLEVEYRRPDFWLIYLDGTEVKIPFSMTVEDIETVRTFLQDVWWMGKEN